MPSKLLRFNGIEQDDVKLWPIERLRREVASALDVARRAENVAWFAFHRVRNATDIAPVDNDAQKAIHALLVIARDKALEAASASCNAETALRNIAEVLGVTDNTPRAKKRKP